MGSAERLMLRAQGEVERFTFETGKNAFANHSKAKILIRKQF